MPCYSPLFALVQKDKNGFKKIKILDRKFAYDLRNNSLKSLDFKEGKMKDVRVTDESWIRNVVTLPCGKCLGCRLDYSRQWADRCMLELQDHEESYFCTFTYDEKHVPVSFYADEKTGEALKCLTLRKEDMQKFFKRLRKDGQKVRYYMCGEYGDRTMRPHYHAIIYGLHIDDLVFYKRNSQGDNLYHSATLQRYWSVPVFDDAGKPLRDEYGLVVYEPIGDVIIGAVTWETCAYTARYVMKKLNGSQADVYDKFNIQKEYVAMSRRPGIGRKYYEDHKEDLWKYSEFFFSTEDGGKRLHPPKYFERLLEKENPEKVEQIKQARMAAMVSNRQFEFASTDEYIELLPPLRESQHASKIKILKGRNKV